MGWVERTKWVRVEDPRIQGLAEGSVQRSTIAQQAVVFIRTSSGTHAVADQCPHQGKSFEGGWCEDGFLVCPWHRMQFDPVTGRNRYGMTGNMTVFPLEQRPEGLFIGFPKTTFRLFGLDLW